MEAQTYSYTRQNLAQVMMQVNENHAPVVVTSQRGKPVVIMSLDDYHSLEETAYLLRHSKGGERLIDSIQEFKNGAGIERELFQ